MRDLWHDLGMQERFFIIGTACILAVAIMAVCLLEPAAPALTDSQVEQGARQHLTTTGGN